eukprot:scaffold1691_cov378-Prasinococcus_capsulatus_cf.AAC.5
MASRRSGVYPPRGRRRRLLVGKLNSSRCVGHAPRARRVHGGSQGMSVFVLVLAVALRPADARGATTATPGLYRGGLAHPGGPDADVAQRASFARAHPASGTGPPLRQVAGTAATVLVPGHWVEMQEGRGEGAVAQQVVALLRPSSTLGCRRAEGPHCPPIITLVIHLADATSVRGGEEHLGAATTARAAKAWSLGRTLDRRHVAQRAAAVAWSGAGPASFLGLGFGVAAPAPHAELPRSRVACAIGPTCVRSSTRTGPPHARAHICACAEGSCLKVLTGDGPGRLLTVAFTGGPELGLTSPTPPRA